MAKKFFIMEGVREMEVAHDIAELKELISQLGLTDDMRDSPRYKVDIRANYSIEPVKEVSVTYGCYLVDVSKSGIAIRTKDLTFKKGALLRIQFSKELNVIGRVVHIDREADEYLVGLESLSKDIDIVSQLLA